MDDFSSVDEGDLWSFGLTPQERSPQRPRLLEDWDCVSDESESQQLYFVSYRWWKDAQNDCDTGEGVLYTIEPNNDTDSQILLVLRKEEASGFDNHLEERFSGLDYALLSEATWLQTLKRHIDFNLALKDARNIVSSEDNLHDLFPLQVRLSVSWNTNSLIVRVNEKDNAVDFYEQARSIFCSKSELRRLWDFSGQTRHFFIHERINHPTDFLGDPYEEIVIEMQVQRFIDSAMRRNTGKDENAEGQQMKDSSILTDEFTDNVNKAGTYSSVRNDDCAGLLGFAGLQNLGNTCFINSAIQCLAHTSKIVDYFLGDFKKEINYENSLGMKGELALAFGGLMRKLWAPGSTSVAPRRFKLKISNFAPQFGGYNQHDSQEFLAFLLDGLHEDLNRVKCKPYNETKDAEGHPHEELAEEYWRNHLARNDSVVVDLCLGQYRSTLICPSCSRPSVTFDPFMYLSLPLSYLAMRSMTLVVFCTDGIAKPSTFTILVPKAGFFKDLIDALSNACSLRDGETFLVAEIYKNHISRFLEDPSDSLEFIRDEDMLVAYRMLKENDRCPLIVFMHQQLEMNCCFGSMSSTRVAFGIPLVARLSNIVKGYDIHKEFLKLLNPFMLSCNDTPSNSENGSRISAIEDFEMHEVHTSASPFLDIDVSSDSEFSSDTDFGSGFTFYLAYGRGDTEGTLIEMNEPVRISSLERSLDVFVIWSDKMIKTYDTYLLSSSPKVCKPQFLSRPQDSISLYKCLEAFSKREPLGPEDMWYCPSCKNHQQANKKLDLWRLPEILIIHLKRFSFSSYRENKLETFVDFPIHDLDFSSYISPKYIQSSNRYKLYAISNHFGNVASGHYTAFVSHDGYWYEFDDETVVPIEEEMIKTSAAYVLFYRRIPDE